MYTFRLFSISWGKKSLCIITNQTITVKIKGRDMTKDDTKVFQCSMEKLTSAKSLEYRRGRMQQLLISLMNFTNLLTGTLAAVLAVSLEIGATLMAAGQYWGFEDLYDWGGAHGSYNNQPLHNDTIYSPIQSKHLTQMTSIIVQQYINIILHER